MDIGIGIPNSIRGTSGEQLIDWASRADRAGFSSLATIGAVAYPGYEELTVLGAAAAVTERIRLLPNVLIAPARSAAELAKQAATVDQLSGGRLTLGVGVGWRASDYELTGRDFDGRGARFDALLGDLRQAWAGEAIADDARPPAPTPVQPELPLLIGGTADASIRRVVEFGVGWTAGGMPPDAVRDHADRVKAAWDDAARDGEPRIVALVYFALGDTETQSRDYLVDYYAPMGQGMAKMIADSALRSEDDIKGAVDAYAGAGVDELVLDPTVADPAQVDWLAKVVL